MEQDFASCWTARARWRRWRNRLRARLRRLALWASLARAIRHMNTTIYDICQVGQGYHQRYLTERSNSKLSFVYVELSPNPAAYLSSVPTICLPPSLRPSAISGSAAVCEDRRRDAL